MSDEPNPTPEPGSTRNREWRNAEAAKRRRRLREVEAERDQLRTRLDATHKAIIEQTAGELFADPSDLWHATSIDDLRGEDSLIDTEGRGHDERGPRAEAALAQGPDPVQDERPESFPAVHQGARSSPEPPAPSFGAQLKDSLRGRR